MQTPADQLGQYGYGLDVDNQIILKTGRPSGLYVTRKGKRLYVRKPCGQLLWSGLDLGDFVSWFWYAKRVSE